MIVADSLHQTLNPSKEGLKMAPPRVLTVDDDTASRRLVNLVLELELNNVEVLEAPSGQECLELLRRQQVDLVLLDLNMPGTSGWEVLRALRSDISLSTIPTIILSGEQPDPRLISELCPQGYITKPFDTYELAERVKRLLSNGHSA